MMRLNKKDWFNPPNPFFSIVKRQFFERAEYWKEVKGRPGDRVNLTDTFLQAQRDHPEIAEFQPMMHSMSILGAGIEAT